MIALLQTIRTHRNSRPLLSILSILQDYSTSSNLRSDTTQSEAISTIMTTNTHFLSRMTLWVSLFGVLMAKTPPSTYPHAYPGMPSTPYGPDWQPCMSQYSNDDRITNSNIIDIDYEVTKALPNITFPLPRAYAGSVSVNRRSHPNDTLFFVAFEKEDGSLTATSDELRDHPWAIWLNGGYVDSPHTLILSVILSIFLHLVVLGHPVWMDCSTRTGHSTSN